MTLAAWPTQLPRPSVDGYAISPMTNVLRTKMDGGQTRQRKRFSYMPSSVNLKVVLSSAHYAIFEAWYSITINDGTDWFTMKLQNGRADQVVTVRFFADSSYKVSNSNGMWIIQGTLEVEAMPRMTSAELTANLP